MDNSESELLVGAHVLLCCMQVNRGTAMQRNIGGDDIMSDRAYLKAASTSPSMTIKQRDKLLQKYIDALYLLFDYRSMYL